MSQVPSFPVTFPEHIGGRVDGFIWEVTLYDFHGEGLEIGTFDFDFPVNVLPSVGDYLIDENGEPMEVVEATFDRDDRTAEIEIVYVEKDDVLSVPSAFDLEHEEEM